MENRRNNTIPFAIIIAAVLIGISIYFAQKVKFDSLNKQYELRMDQQNLSERADRERKEANDKFNNNLKCQELLDDLRKRWNNIVGIYYSENYNSCIVKFKKRNGEIDEAPIEEMVDAK